MFVGRPQCSLVDSWLSSVPDSISVSQLQRSGLVFVVLVTDDSFLVEVLDVRGTLLFLCLIDPFDLASFDSFLHERTGNSDGIEFVDGFGAQ